MKSYIFVIIGMMVVTYIPRLLPLAVLSEKPLPPLIRRFLTYIPFAALGALIIPGVVKATPDRPVAAIAGVVAAAVIAWFRGGLIFPVMASITAAYLVLVV